MSAFRPGQAVVCIRDGWKLRGVPCPGPIKGRVYTINRAANPLAPSDPRQFLTIVAAVRQAKASKRRAFGQSPDRKRALPFSSECSRLQPLGRMREMGAPLVPGARGRFLPALIALAFSLSSPAAALDITARDRGGNVLEYIVRFCGAKPVRVFASCESACAAAALRCGACLGPGGSFKVHAPWGAGKGNAAAKAFYMRQLSPPVRRWVNSQGGLTSRMLTVPRRLTRSCS